MTKAHATSGRQPHNNEGQSRWDELLQSIATFSDKGFAMELQRAAIIFNRYSRKDANTPEE